MTIVDDGARAHDCAVAHRVPLASMLNSTIKLFMCGLDHSAKVTFVPESAKGVCVDICGLNLVFTKLNRVIVKHTGLAGRFR